MNYKDDNDWGSVYEWAKPDTQNKEPQWSEIYDWAKPPQTATPEPPKPSLWDNIKSTAGKVGNLIPESTKHFQILPSKQGIDAVKNYDIKENKDTNRTPLGQALESTPVGGALSNTVQAGVGDFNYPVYKALQAVGGDKIPGVNKFLEIGAQQARQMQEKGGTDVGSQVARSTIAMLPNMALTYLTQGASLPYQIPAMGGEAIRQATMQMLKNPAFISSTIRSFGNAYGEAEEA